MVFQVVDPKGLSVWLSFVSRDNQLNEKAYQRAITKRALNEGKAQDLYLSVTFILSQNISPQQMTQEKLSREFVVKMQNELNNQFFHSGAELLIH